MLLKFLGLAPDKDSTLEGVLTACAAVIPSKRGLRSAPGARDLGIAALAAKSLGAALTTDLLSVKRVYTGTQTALFEQSGTGWTDRTRTVGGAYTGGTENLWRFTQFGNVTVAVNRADTMQQATGGAFSDITGAPKAATIETVGQFLIACDTNDATDGDRPDGWYCSALGSHTDWTPSIATQCAKGRITSIPGKITAGKRLGERFIIYKLSGISVGVYTGASSFIWDFQDIPVDFGAASHDAVVDIGNAHLFMGPKGFFSFDGATVQAIDEDIREWWLARVDERYFHLARSAHNKDLGVVYWWYVPNGLASPMLTECLAYSYRLNRWGQDDREIEAAVEYVQAGVTWDGLGALYATWDDLPNIAYDSSFWVAGSPVPAIFDASHKLAALDAVAGAWSLTTGDFGDEYVVTTFKSAVPKYFQAPLADQLQNGYRMQLGNTRVLDDAVATFEDRFNVLRAARYHSVTLSGSGDMELSGLNVEYREVGRE